MRILALALLVVVVLTSSASAQRLPFYNPENSYFELAAFCEPGAPTLVKVWIHVTPEFESPAQTVRITRDVRGEDDSPSIIGTIDLEGLAPGEHNFEFEDPDPVDMLAVLYNAWGYTAEGTPASFVWSWEFTGSCCTSFVDYATCGNTMIGHGRIGDGYSGMIWFEPCEDGRDWGPISIGNPDDPLVQPFVNSGREVFVFGDIECGWAWIEGCIATIDTIYEMPCGTVDTEPTSWGSIKSRY